MPEAEEGNRTEDVKIVHVRTNVACANKWCMCRQMAKQMRTKDDKRWKCEKMLLVRTNVAYADECCMFGEMLQITWAAKRQ